MSEWLTQKQVAELERISGPAVYKRLQRGDYTGKTRKVSAKGGHRGKRTEIHLSALSEAAQRRYYGTPRPNDASSPAPPAGEETPTRKGTVRAEQSQPAPGTGEQAARADQDDYWLSAKEFAWRIRKSSRTIRRWCRFGKLQRVRQDPVTHEYQIHLHELEPHARWRWYREHNIPEPDSLKRDMRQDLSHIPKRDRETVYVWLRRLRRFQLILDATGQRPAAAAPAFCAQEQADYRPSTLLKKYCAWGKDGMYGLVSYHSHKGRRKIELQERALAWLWEHYYTSPLPNMHLSIDALRQKAIAAGWEIPASDRTLMRRIEEIPEAVKLKYQSGHKALDDLFLPPTRRSYEFDPMYIWCSDHHQFDVMVALPDGKIVRPWFTGWLDLKSRKVLSWMIVLQPNSDSIAWTFYRACKLYGSPQHVLIDNGKDYTCYRLVGTQKPSWNKNSWKKTRFRLLKRKEEQYLRGAFDACGVERPVFARPYNAKSKPKERFFNTLAQRFSAQLPGYCGRSPAHKPEKLARELAEHQMLPFEEFEALCGQWIEGWYHLHKHRGKGMQHRSPNDVFEQERMEARYVPEENLRLLFLKTDIRTVQRDGINLFKQWYRNPEIQFSHFKQEVTVRYDPWDLTAISVYDLTTDEKLGDAPIVGEADFFNVDEITRQKREHKLYQQWTNWWVEINRGLLDGTLELKERLGIAVNAPSGPPPREMRGADAKIVHMVQPVSRRSDSAPAATEEDHGKPRLSVVTSDSSPDKRAVTRRTPEEAFEEERRLHDEARELLCEAGRQSRERAAREAAAKQAEEDEIFYLLTGGRRGRRDDWEEPVEEEDEQGQLLRSYRRGDHHEHTE